MSRVRRDFQILTDLEDPICDSFSDGKMRSVREVGSIDVLVLEHDFVDLIGAKGEFFKA
jgi:hypothetical protein